LHPGCFWFAFCLQFIRTYVGEDDYNGGRIVVDVPAGVLSQSFLINITDDSIVECNETFSVVIETVSTCQVTIGNVNTSEVTKIDNDGM